MDKSNMHSSGFDNPGNKSKKMNIKTQLLSLIIGLLNLILLGLIPYTYLQKQEVQDNKIDSEVVERKAAILAINTKLDKKVDISAFEEFKTGQQEIRNDIKSSINRERSYREIIKELSFINIDTSNFNYDKLTFEENIY
jgi:hypothetical protein